MAILNKIPAYFSGFAPVLQFGANMGNNDCIITLDNSNEDIIKNGSVITYDWNDPTKVIIQNGNSTKTVTLNFYSNGPSGQTLIGDPKPYIQWSGALTISHAYIPWDKTKNIFYANNNCLVCEVSSDTTSTDGIVGSSPRRNNPDYSNWYEDYASIDKTGTYKLKFYRTKMSGAFEITVNYKEWETEE